MQSWYPFTQSNTGTNKQNKQEKATVTTKESLNALLLQQPLQPGQILVRRDADHLGLLPLIVAKVPPRKVRERLARAEEEEPVDVLLPESFEAVGPAYGERDLGDEVGDEGFRSGDLRSRVSW